ncbi:MAG: asparagine synthase (glutamine-hydrolyzing), partial [Zetaproteobacteria bacterium]
MRGFAGGVFVPESKRKAFVSGALAALKHRGPDDSGAWEDMGTGVVLAHARLAVLDLSHAGRQPMASASGRFVVAYNGEIYNHLALRKELEKAGQAPRWRGHADTETLLAAVEAWGVKEALGRFVGMFAFALWDKKNRTLYLARDRFGEKPLYYGWVEDAFVFASELKALAAYPGWRGEVDREALAAFMRFGYVPAPRSIYQGIWKLEPGCLLALRQDALQGAWPEPERYWSLADAASKSGSFSGDAHEAEEALDRLLRETIRDKMLADVPLGAFLSGGIDSSTVVAVMQAESVRPVRTFSIGFHEEGYNEAPFAKKIAEHLGTEHTELYLTPQDALDVVPTLARIWDEPFA